MPTNVLLLFCLCVAYVFVFVCFLQVGLRRESACVRVTRSAPASVSTCEPPPLQPSFSSSSFLCSPRFVALLLLTLLPIHSWTDGGAHSVSLEGMILGIPTRYAISMFVMKKHPSITLPQKVKVKSAEPVLLNHVTHFDL